jgi:hypothetical protein
MSKPVGRRPYNDDVATEIADVRQPRPSVVRAVGQRPIFNRNGTIGI